MSIFVLEPPPHLPPPPQKKKKKKKSTIERRFLYKQNMLESTEILLSSKIGEKTTR